MPIVYAATSYTGALSIRGVTHVGALYTEEIFTVEVLYIYIVVEEAIYRGGLRRRGRRVRPRYPCACAAGRQFGSPPRPERMEHSTERSTEHLMERSTEHSTGHSTEHLMEHLLDHSSEHSTEHLTKHVFLLLDLRPYIRVRTHALRHVRMNLKVRG